MKTTKTISKWEQYRDDLVDGISARFLLRERTTALERMRAAIEKATVAYIKADPDASDDITRVLSAAMSATTRAGYREAGYKIKGGWGRAVGGKAGAPCDPLSIDNFCDHSYRLVGPGGEVVYMTEPYTMNATGLEQLREIAGDTWDVSVGAAGLHAPGSTIRVTFERKAG